MIAFDYNTFHAKEKGLIIQSFFDGRNSHAQLFYGPSGNGKFTVAMAYVALLLCEQPSEKGACMTCASCKQMAKLTHPDVHFIFPTYIDKSNDLDGLSEEFIKTWREAVMANPYLSFGDWKRFINAEQKTMQIRVKEAAYINEKLSYKSFYGGYKVVFIWLPELLNTETANKLLKNIEEPEDKTVIIMVSERYGLLLPTITSRMQSVYFPRLTEEEVRKALEAKGVGNPEVLAQLAEGNLSDALELAAQSDSLTELATYFTLWMRVSYSVNMPEIIKLSEDLSKKSRAFTIAFLQFSLQTIRQAVLSNFRTSTENPIFANTDFKMVNFSKIINPENAWLIMNELDSAVADIERTCSVKIVMTDLSIRVHYLLKRGIIPKPLDIL
ncbi:MAG: hypothetical protein LAT54_05770 [Cryomorphaceae bacterium]|nr:hypothetical protein [Cryomorphaceae bacterium]